MAPSHTISTRRPTEPEQRVIAAQAGTPTAGYGCILIAFGWIPLALLVVIAAVLTGWLPPAPWYAWAVLAGGLVVSAWILVWMLAQFRAHERKQRAKADRDLEKMTVEVIEVREPRAVEIVPNSPAAPALALDVGGGRVLYLQGQWLREGETYGAPRQTDEPDESYFNGYPPPHAFPSTRFALARLPESGRVLGILVSGSYVPVGDAVDVLRPEHEMLDSELIAGSLDALSEAFAEARRGRPTNEE